MQKDLLKQLQETSYLAPGNIAYIEELYDSYLKDPKSVSQNWQEYFAKLRSEKNPQANEVPISTVRQHFLNLAKSNHVPQFTIGNAEQITKLQKQIHVDQLINAYRTYGHEAAKLDPLGLLEKQDISELHLGHYGFTHADLDLTFNAAKFLGKSNVSLREIHSALLNTYCSTLGMEYMHITDPTEVEWLRNRIEAVQSHPQFSTQTKKQILKELIQAEGLEKYLGSKYVGQTRFSLEGGETLIPMLNELVQRSGMHGVKELIIGMGHRGRLNVLVNTIGKPIEKLLSEFEGKSIKPGYSGDVKYHSGFSSNLKTPGGIIHLALTFNPSHLEIIDPVVEGSVRARQDNRADIQHNKVVPVLIHGDAAFSGQGVVMETFSFSQARGFTTGGTIHIVVNNQIGFTTSNPQDARSSLYCTDIAKMVQAPIFHVNGDDPESCAFAMQLAIDFRMEFNKDVVIDLVCYRKLGHNEADEPSATQPLMYRVIKQHPRISEIYAKRLIEEKIITAEQVTEEINNYRNALDNRSVIIPILSKEESGDNYANWNPYKDIEWTHKTKTSISLKTLEKLGKKITELPETFVLQTQVAKEYDNRRAMLKGEMPFNWGFAETLAYASIVSEGYPVRLSGQDCGRGTFAHRHAVLYDQNDGKAYIPLKHIADDQEEFTVIDSILSEEAVLGFEYGYATTDPETLVIWEAHVITVKIT